MIFIKTKKSEILTMLRKCEADLAAANTVISKNTKTINTLTKRNNDLVVTPKAAHDDTREAKDYAKGVKKSSLVGDKITDEGKIQLNLVARLFTRGQR
jgi:hypothetical protein